MAGVFFRIDGADIDSGQEKILVLEADTAEQAEEMARNQGLVIAAVRAATEEDRTSPKPLEPAREDLISKHPDLEFAPPVVTFPSGVDGKSIFSDGPPAAIAAAQSAPMTAVPIAVAPKPVASTPSTARPAPARIPPPRIVRPPASGAVGSGKPMIHRVPPVHRAPSSGSKPAGSLREAGGLSSGSSLLAERVRKKPAPPAPAHEPLVSKVTAPPKSAEPARPPEAAPIVPLVAEEPASALAEINLEPIDKIPDLIEEIKTEAAPIAKVEAAPEIVAEKLQDVSPIAAVEEPAAWSHASSLVAGKVAVVERPKTDAYVAPQPANAKVTIASTVPISTAPTVAASPQSSSNWLATLLLCPLAFLSLAAGIALMVYSLSRPEPADPTDLQKLDVHVQLLTHCLLGGMLVLGGLLLFVAAGLVYVAGAMRSARR